jgi:hypothetical protein
MADRFEQRHVLGAVAVGEAAGEADALPVGVAGDGLCLAGPPQDVAIHVAGEHPAVYRITAGTACAYFWHPTGPEARRRRCGGPSPAVPDAEALDVVIGLTAFQQRLQGFRARTGAAESMTTS